MKHNGVVSTEQAERTNERTMEQNVAAFGVYIYK